MVYANAKKNYTDGPRWVYKSIIFLLYYYDKIFYTVTIYISPSETREIKTTHRVYILSELSQYTGYYYACVQLFLELEKEMKNKDIRPSE